MQPLLQIASPFGPARGGVDGGGSGGGVGGDLVGGGGFGGATPAAATEDESERQAAVGVLDDPAWALDCRRIAARALASLCQRESLRAELLSAGSAFRLLELAADADAAISRYGTHALRLLSESESQRPLLLAEPGLLQGG